MSLHAPNDGESMVDFMIRRRESRSATPQPPVAQPAPTPTPIPSGGTALDQNDPNVNMIDLMIQRREARSAPVIEQPPPTREVQQPTPLSLEDRLAGYNQQFTKPSAEKKIKQIQDASVGGTVLDGIGIGDALQSGWDWVTGSDRKTDQTRELSELSNAYVSLEDKAKITGAMMVSANEKDRKDILTKNIPGISFETDSKGNTIVNLPENEFGFDKKAVLNKPGFSMADAQNVFSNILAFLPAGRVAAIAGGLAARTGVGVAASGATDAAIQGAGIAAGRERDLDLGEVAVSAAIGGASELIPGALTKRFKKTVERSEGIEEGAEQLGKDLALVEGIAEETIPLFVAQRSMLGSDLKTQALLPQLSGSGKVAAKALKEQSRATLNAAMAVIDTITIGKASPDGFKSLQDASKKVLSDAKKARSDIVAPLYKEAFDDPSARAIDTSALHQKVADMLDGNTISPSSDAAKALTKFVQLTSGAKGQLPSLELLQTAKIDILRQMKAYDPTSSINANTKRAIRPFVDDLHALLLSSSPKFVKADKRFAKESKNVNAIEESLLPQINKVPDTKLEKVADQLFGPGVTETATEQARKLIRSTAGGQKAWDNIVKAKVLKQIRSIDVSGDISPAKLQKAIFGNEVNRKQIMAAMRPQAKLNFDALFNIMERVKVGRHEGSSTASNLMALMQGSGSALTNKSLVGHLTDISYAVLKAKGRDRQQEKLAELMFNPDFKIGVLNSRPGDIFKKGAPAYNSISQALMEIADADEGLPPE